MILLKSKYLLIVFVTFFCVDQVKSAKKPDEAKIHFHIHQAATWAELIYSNSCVFSKVEMRKHFKIVKYSEGRLVDSIFYKDYIFLRKIAFNEIEANQKGIDILLNRINKKSQKIKLNIQAKWQNEFLICQK